MMKDSTYTPTLENLAVLKGTWQKSEDGTTYLWTDTPGLLHTREDFLEFSTEQLEAIDARLPVLFEEAFKRKIGPPQRSVLLAQTSRFWLNAHPMPFGMPFFKNTYIDKVEFIEFYNTESQSIKLKADAVEIEIVKGVPIVRKMQKMTTAVKFENVEPYYPDFQKRMAVAEGLNMSDADTLSFVFPVAPKVNELFQTFTTPPLPDFT